VRSPPHAAVPHRDRVAWARASPGQPVGGGATPWRPPRPATSTSGPPPSGRPRGCAARTRGGAAPRPDRVAVLSGGDCSAISTISTMAGHLSRDEGRDCCPGLPGDFPAIALGSPERRIGARAPSGGLARGSGARAPRLGPTPGDLRRRVGRPTRASLGSAVRRGTRGASLRGPGPSSSGRVSRSGRQRRRKKWPVPLAPNRNSGPEKPGSSACQTSPSGVAVR
jgi:hypothetical protein